MQTKLLLASLAFGALVIPACSSSTSTTAGDPIITAITVTDSPVPVNTDGSYDIDMSITFTDVVDVDTFTLSCTDGTPANDINITNGAISPAVPSGTFTLTVHLPVGTVTGTYTCEFSVIDTDNVQSATFAADFVLQ